MTHSTCLAKRILLCRSEYLINVWIGDNISNYSTLIKYSVNKTWKELILRRMFLSYLSHPIAWRSRNTKEPKTKSQLCLSSFIIPKKHRPRIDPSPSLRRYFIDLNYFWHLSTGPCDDRWKLRRMDCSGIDLDRPVLAQSSSEIRKDFLWQTIHWFQRL